MLVTRGGDRLVGAIVGLLLFGFLGSERVAWGEERIPTREFRLYDGFDGKLALDWEVIRPNPETASLTKNPGKLTITSEYGGLHTEARTGKSAKNLYMIPNPAKDGGDFVVTTCIDGFHPTGCFQHAGPHIYDDDNHYLKANIGYSYQGTVVGSPMEINGCFCDQGLFEYVPNLKWERFWLRIIKRGNVYESAYSTDGKTYTICAEQVWGNGAPKKVGLGVMDEDQSPPKQDAAFDFFEVRSLTAEEKNDPVYQQRQKLQGIWEFVSSQADGQSMPKDPLSRFEFRGMSLLMTERGRSLTTQYALDPTKQPKEMKITRPSSDATTAIYHLDGDSLVVCMSSLPDAPTPTELETKEGDGRLLVTLKRMPAVKAAAVARSAVPFRLYFLRLDSNRDQMLTKEELLVDYPSAEAAKQGSEVFDLLDGNHDGKLSLEEFNKRSSKVQYLQMDLDANGSLSVDELINGAMRGVSEDQAAQIFAGFDSNGDGRVTFEEFQAKRRQAPAHAAAAGANARPALPPVAVPVAREFRVAAEAPRPRESANNLKRIGLAMHNHHDTFQAFPAGYSADKEGKPLLSWRVCLLPYFEKADLYNEFHLDEPWDSPHNKKLIEKMPDVYRAQGSKSKPGMTNYLGVSGADGVFVRPRPGEHPNNRLGTSMRQITDGTSNTIMVVEVADESAVIWTKPGDFAPKKDKPLQGLVGLRPGGFLAGFADGSVRFMADSIEADVLKALFTKSGGEAVKPPR
jgi:uncharacterized protein (TIGR03067 family)